jgi:nucleotide-binding universal stress UspA family protein
MFTTTEDPQANAVVRLQRLLVCFCSSDDWRALVSMAGRLALPGNAAVHVCCKDLAKPKARGETKSGKPGIQAGSVFASLLAAEALKSMGLSVQFDDHPTISQEIPGGLPPYQQADLVVMTKAFNSSMTFGSQDLASRAVRLLRKPILFIRGEGVALPALQNHIGPAVAAVSLSERSHQVVQEAAHYAGTLGSGLSVVHVVDILHDFSRPDNLMGLMCACEMLQESVTHSGLKVDCRLSYGAVPEVLTKAEFVKDAPFLALGVNLNEDQADAAESDALRERIVRNAPCPVLLIPTQQLRPDA